MAYCKYLNIAQCLVHTIHWLNFSRRQLNSVAKQRECESNVLGHVVPMHIKWVALATDDKNSNHGTLLFIEFIITFMHCKHHLHTADNSSRQSIFAKKVGFKLRKKSMILEVGVTNIL